MTYKEDKPKNRQTDLHYNSNAFRVETITEMHKLKLFRTITQMHCILKHEILHKSKL
jgi:hypothetical protein